MYCSCGIICPNSIYSDTSKIRTTGHCSVVLKKLKNSSSIGSLCGCLLDYMSTIQSIWEISEDKELEKEKYVQKVFKRKLWCNRQKKCKCIYTQVYKHLQLLNSESYAVIISSVTLFCTVGPLVAKLWHYLIQVLWVIYLLCLIKQNSKAKQKTVHSSLQVFAFYSPATNKSQTFSKTYLVVSTFNVLWFSFHTQSVCRTKGHLNSMCRWVEWRVWLLRPSLSCLGNRCFRLLLLTSHHCWVDILRDRGNSAQSQCWDALIMVKLRALKHINSLRVTQTTIDVRQRQEQISGYHPRCCCKINVTQPLTWKKGETCRKKCARYIFILTEPCFRGCQTNSTPTFSKMWAFSNFTLD